MIVQDLLRSEGKLDFTCNPKLIESIENIPFFIHSRLDTYDDIICDKKDLQLFPLRSEMKFVGRSYLKEITVECGIVLIEGVFDSYTDKGEMLKVW